MDDYYKLLGVTMTVGVIDLRRAWRRLALQWHPDRAGADATRTFQKIQAAYAVLADPVSRAAYDQRRAGAAPATRGRASSIKLTRLSGNINGLFACGIAIKTGGDIIELCLTADEAATGGHIELAMRVPVRRDGKIVDDLFAAWLAVPAGVRDGEILPPSAYLPGMINRVLFRARLPRV